MTAARLALAAAGILFSTGGAAIKLSALSSWQVACSRSAVAALVLALAWPAGRRGWTRRTLLVAAGYAACVVSFVMANKLTTAASAIYIQYAAPLYIVLTAPFVLGERSRRADYIIAGVIMLGLAAFFLGSETPQMSAPNPAAGNLLAVVSGLSFAALLIGMRWLQAPGPGSTDPGTVIVAGNLMAAVVAAPFALPFPTLGVVDVSVIGFLGVIQIGLAYVLVTHGVRLVPAFEASLILLLEPVLNPVWTWLTLGETPGPLAAVGGVLILSGTAVKSWLDRRVADL